MQMHLAWPCHTDGNEIIPLVTLIDPKVLREKVCQLIFSYNCSFFKKIQKLRLKSKSSLARWMDKWTDMFDIEVVL